jgi:hypothetical protein
MKATLVILIALGVLAVAIPGTAEAHIAICHLSRSNPAPGLECLAQCELDHLVTAPPHACAVVIEP